MENSVSFVRLKYRPAPIHPSSEGVHVMRGPKKRHRDRYAPGSLELLDWSAENVPAATNVPMNPHVTQLRRKERKCTSFEKKHRRDTAPSIEDLLRIRKTYLREMQVEEELERRRKQQTAQMSKLEEALVKGNADEVSVEEEGTQPVEMDSGDDEDITTAEFKQRALEMKEKKITFQRNSKASHVPLSPLQRYRLAISVWMKSGKIKREPVTKVLPWMFLGNKEYASNQGYLLSLGITHVLNVTRDVQNFHADKFVYLRIPVRDTEVEDIGSRFKKSNSFFQRVAKVKGKVYVHCSSGSSRAPTLILAYFVAVRKISLLDAYVYLQAVRTSVSPNPHFLFQLGRLEVDEGLGSSVLFHHAW
eukprot:CAMPEP_0185023836 /NCGR_PEP_ID=MMETSP1103-20130426/6459_1 /TAXON_ID=36769 /ORGANISM="Paraphysomonas bandaiensis, Strain Caron Lab Isolate" /LENGTH=360 /DNA_ID=CAMNT_0027556599 /DNA_START=141 /DNA_END=1220 /DNA_ORIENTATION=+